MGGDHKCPLCSATFTRPQHVGRHLRAHTGDRPYECKECPLRFARSDLLSRHVNKAHPKPNGQHGSHKNEKKGRSKSLSTATGMTPTRPPPMVGGVASRGPLQAEPTAYQAQRMYPNHPLLQQGPNGAAAWGTAGLNLTGAGVANFNMGLGGTTVAHLPSDVIGSVGNATAPGITLLHPFAGPPMYAPSDTTHLIPAAYDLATSLPNLNGSHPVTTFGYELNTKKRACDQCNHSKVRCDFADPCARCNYRHVQCTYTKPPRNARGRNVTYPMPAGMNANLSTSPTRTQSLNQQPTNVFSSPGMVRPQPLANDAAMDRRDSAQSQSSASSDFLRSDGQRVRASGPESQWDGSAYHHPRSHSGSTVSSVGNSSFVAQSPGSGLGLSLTPSLTNETSPSVGSDGPDRRGSQSSMNNNAAWVLPPSLLNHESAVKFVNTFMNGDMSNGLNSANPQFVWPSHHGGLDTSMLPNDALSVTDDESGSTPPDFADGTRPRRRSSAGMWANALKEMHIDDGQGLLDPALADIEFTVPTSFRTPAEGSQTPLDRNLSGSDVNLWKLFLDPGALATPMMFNPETPRLNKSNSAPDLTTPCISHDLANPMENIGQKSEGDADDEETARLKSEKDSPEDKEVRDKWKDHISQRHASFNMNPDAAATVRTRALTNASFASSTSPQRQVRPSLHPLMHVSAGDETLAPERLPSFGPAAFDMNGVLLTPNYRGPMTPSKHFNNVVESRPANKRQASQTLVGDNQKRTTFGLWNDEDDNNTPTDSSRHTSGTAANLAALRSAKIAANASANIPTWQAADASRAC